MVGGGAREDALAWLLARSPSVETVFAAPGNAGTAARAVNWPLSATDGKPLVARALAEHIDLAVLGPETAIAAGVGDRFREAKIAVFGPNRAPGRLESSKVYAKRFMERNGIPTAKARIVHSLSNAERILADWRGGCVVKADGLAAGKGVVIAPDAATALATVREWYGAGVPGGGSDVLLEEKLEGREVSVFAVGDGHGFVPFGAACDYKRAADGDEGPNTGGMGAYSPPHGFPDDLYDLVTQRILTPLGRGLAADGERYFGVLYCGLMWTSRGPAVIEFNVRFGDPEMQVLAPRVRGDFARYLMSAASGALERDAASLAAEACVGVVLATPDYPGASAPVHGLRADLALGPDRFAFWGPSELREGAVDARGGRVVTICATGEGLAEARQHAYAAVAEALAKLDAPLRCRRDVAALGAGETTGPPAG